MNATFILKNNSFHKTKLIYSTLDFSLLVLFLCILLIMNVVVNNAFVVEAEAVSPGLIKRIESADNY